MIHLKKKTPNKHPKPQKDKELLLYTTVEEKDELATWMQKLEYFFRLQKNWNVGLLTWGHGKQHLPLYMGAAYKPETVQRARMSTLTPI